MATMLGYTPDEMIGKHLFCFMDETIVEFVKENLNKRAQGIRASSQFEFKHKDGRKVITYLNAYPLMENDGKYNGALAAVTDITDRKELGKIVHELEIKFKSIFDYASIGLALLNKDLQILDANENFCEKLEYQKEEIVNVNLLSIFLPENHEELRNNIHEICSGTSHDYVAEYKFLRKTGSIGWGFTNFIGIKEGQNQEIKIIFSLRDITESKNFEIEVFKRDALFKSVFDNSTDAITIWDNELRNLYANPAAFAQIGRKIEPLPLRRHMREGLPNMPGFEEKWEKRVLECFTSGISHNYTDVDKIGTDLVWSESLTSPITDADGSTFAVAIIFRDVSKRKKMEQELIRTEKLSLIGKMAAHISHEIRSPLAAICMNIELLSKNLKLNKKQNKSVEIINDELKWLDNLLKDILSFSREYSLNKKYFDMSELIHEIHALIKINLKTKKIKFINKVNAQIIYGDPDRIKTVLIDLIENSVEAIDTKGTIELYSEIKVDENMFGLFIKDSGCGVTDSSKLYDPFYTNKIKGTGLGLSNVKNIIEKHGGIINLVSSKPGETIFQIKLPINEKTGS